MGAAPDGLRLDVDVAEDLVFGVQIMAVPGGDHRLAGQMGGLDDVLQHLDEMLLGGQSLGMDEIGIVLDRLDLDKVIELHRFDQGVFLSRQGEFENLPVEASGA